MSRASDLGMGRTDLRSPEGSSGWSGQRSDPDRLLETARRHEVRSCEVLQGRSDVPIRASSHHSGGRQVKRTRPSPERAATVGTQVRQSTTDPTVSRTPTVAGHPTRQVGSDEGTLRAVSVSLGDRGITPRSPKWLSMRSEAVQRMAMASRVNIALLSWPLSPAFSVERCASDSVTRGGKFVSPTRISSTLKGIPPPSCLVASPSFGNSVSSGPSVGNSGSSGKRASGILDNSAASGLTGMLSGSASGPFVLPVPKSAGDLLKKKRMLDQQLTKAFQTGLRPLTG